MIGAENHLERDEDADGNALGSRLIQLCCMLPRADSVSTPGASSCLVLGGWLFIMRSERQAVALPLPGLGVPSVKWNNHSTFLKVRL